MQFDEYHDRYIEEVRSATSFAGQDVDFYAEAKARHLRDLTKRHIGDPGGLRVLDVGCGVGLTDRFLAPCFGTLFGADMSAASVSQAARSNPSVHHCVYDGTRLPFADDTLDVSLAVNVMHHIQPTQWREFLRELGRVTRPRGLVVIFEHNPANPLTRLVVRRCEFDAEAVLLWPRRLGEVFRASGLTVIEKRYLLFFPWRGRLVDLMERGLRCVPLGAQYYMAGRASRRHGDSDGMERRGGQL